MSSVVKVMAGMSTSISDFKANPNSVIQASEGEAVAVLKSNQPYFYAVPPGLFEKMTEAMENLALLLEANSRMSDGMEPVEISLDDL